MMQSKIKKSLLLRLLPSVVSLVLLSACGGGDKPVIAKTPSYEAPQETSGLRLAVAAEEPRVISVWPGDVDVRRITLTRSSAAITATLSITGDTTGLSIDRVGDQYILKIDSRNSLPGVRREFRLEAKNTENGLIEELPLTLAVLSPAVEANGTLPRSGGAISNSNGAYGLQVNPNQLTANVSVTIESARVNSNITRLRFLFSRDVSNETGIVTLISNRAQVTAKTISVASLRAQSDMQISTAQAANTEYSVNRLINNFPAYWLVGGGRLANISNQLNILVQHQNLAVASFGSYGGLQGGGGYYNRQAYVDLVSNATQINSTRTALELSNLKRSLTGTQRKIVPVLFVHGYTPSVLQPGGEDTWADFPELVEQMSNAERQYVAFEFVWRTNASFNVVADDLAFAIQQIYNLTGERTQIIAHSFGGLLTRTLLQGLGATQSNFDANLVRGVLTLGTPHSGIFDRMTSDGSTLLPQGQYGEQIEFCGQVSCFQAGERVNFGGPETYSLLGIREEGETIRDLRSTALPPNIPFIAGIGLKRNAGDNVIYDDGDGLISFSGQRFFPDSGPLGDLRQCELENLLVKEIVLGAYILTSHDRDARPGALAINSGYTHSSSLPAPATGIELAEAKVECADAVTCEHGSFKVFRSMMLNPRDYCVRADTVTPKIQPSLIGGSIKIAMYFPNLSTQVTRSYSTNVTSQIEFLSGSISSLTDSSLRVIGSDTDIGPNYIDVRYKESLNFAQGEFNGEVLTFDSDGPEIVGAKLDPASSYRPDEVLVSYDNHSVTINYRMARSIADSRVLIRIDLADATLP